MGNVVKPTIGRDIGCWLLYAGCCDYVFEKHTSIVVMKLKVAFGRSGAAGQLPMSICIVCRSESERIHVFLLSHAVMLLGMFLLPHDQLTSSE